MPLPNDIRSLPGIGEKRAVLLSKLGIKTVSDIIAYYPRDYEDRTVITPVADVLFDETNIIKARVISSGANKFYNGKCLTVFDLQDDTGRITAHWFNQPYMKQALKKHGEYVFIGMVSKYNGKPRIYPADYQTAEDAAKAPIIPKYRLTPGLSPKIFRKIVSGALGSYAPQDTLPEYIVKKASLAPTDFAARNIHFPESREAFYKARERLVFEEIFTMRLALLRIRDYVKNEKRGVVFTDTDMSGFINKLPFALTDGQAAALGDIITDVTGGFAMNRLLQGDVGCGKTAVAAAACYLCVKNGYRAAVMAPTEVLAKQHFAYFSAYFDNAVLLTGKMTAPDRKKALARIQDGSADIIIGTHAVISEGVFIDSLALCITDEQHRFGVRQRRLLSEKGADPHILVMTATPIPRSLALILYGDMDITAITDMPKGRQAIETYAVNSAYRKRIFAFCRKEIEKGNQVYFICPCVGESDNAELKSVSAYEKEAAAALGGLQTAKLYGKMKQDEKDYIMEEFRQGRIKALVSTTVIEVGINVPAATVMIIENAERFGLLQLHQLRGRVGRGAEKSYCILISDSDSQVTKQRLAAMSRTNSGFELSQSDLELRGPGDFFGTKQHGLPDMKIANLYTDGGAIKKTEEILDSMTPEEKRETARILGLDGALEAAVTL